METRWGTGLPAAGPTAERRAPRRWSRRAGALLLAALAQAALLWLIAIQQRAIPFPTERTEGMPVWVVHERAARAERRATAPRSTAPEARRAAAPAQPSPASSLPEVAPPSSGGPAPGPAAGAPAGIGSALRASIVGCANAAALGLSDAERAKCRDALAAGASTSPYRWGIPGAKHAYYDAILAAEAKYRNDPGGGHGPAVFCYPGRHAGRPLPHALKIGPCYIEPPQGMLDVDVDVPEVGSQRDLPPPPR
jgi:hypothetical protein